MADELNQLLDGYQGINGEISYPEFKIGEAFSTRDASGIIMQEIPKKVLGFLGGSADLAASNKTEIPDFGDFTLDNPRGRTIRFGVREHAMASITNGLLLYGLKAFCATLVVFIDYMRPAMRLAAIMNLPAVYILTHDSIYLGGDGPTHIPIEHLNSLRIIPNMRVLRPADPQETVVAWQMALERQDGPTALFLSRQDLAVFEKHDSNWETSLRQYGAYTVRDCEGKPDLVLLATGSEVETLLKAVEGIDHKNVRILSVLSREMLEEAYEKDPEKLIPEGSTCLVFEAGSSSGWTVFTGGNKKQVFSIDGFAVSGRPEENAEHFGYTPEGFLKFIKGYC